MRSFFNIILSKTAACVGNVAVSARNYHFHCVFVDAGLYLMLLLIFELRSETERICILLSFVQIYVLLTLYLTIRF